MCGALKACFWHVNEELVESSLGKNLTQILTKIKP